MSLYRYSGPASAVTLEGSAETILIPGSVVELPADSPWVKTMIARGLLTLARPAEESKPAPKAEGRSRSEAPAEKEKT
ncbi:hypothetical protein [Neomegalonema sp.]|uniref:hypothetical protein n=1 Tax=Neomegalonema sp. TaxID=2039713 RepID=UPI00260BDFDF|nr:hypothetical protein [Neomegalonema sp.]MDD2870085.1 hypothetical protein [Neomegalonema sp.]